jgi:Putative Actinobacterial Holin-X, holin superfamily III
VPGRFRTRARGNPSSMEENTTTGQGPGGVGEIAGSFAADVATLVQREMEAVTASLRAEIERLRQDATERAGEAGRGAALLGAAGGLGLVAAGAVASLPLLALRRVLPSWVVALLVAGGAGTGAALLGRAGLEHVKLAAPDSISERIDQAAGDVSDALKQRVSSVTAEES